MTRILGAGEVKLSNDVAIPKEWYQIVAGFLYSLGLRFRHSYSEEASPPSPLSHA